MKSSAFAMRNVKEIIRDPLNIMFGVGFPVILLLLFKAIQSNIPEKIFEMKNIAPGLAVFSLSFVSLFAGILIAKDRSTSFLTRLYVSPLKAGDFMLGYIMPLIPVALLQIAICYAAALLLGLEFSVNLLLSVILMIPSIMLYIGIGLLSGTLFTDKQVGGFCGALLTNLTGWLGGTFFDINLVGGAFKTAAEILPFYHASEAARAAVSGSFEDITMHLLIVSGYAVAVCTVAVLLFKRKMKNAE